MKALISFLTTIVVISLLVCIVGWVFATDFLIFDMLLMLVVGVIQIAVPLVILVILIWVALEFLT